MTLTSVLSADAEAALIALISEHHEQADQALERPLADWSQWLDSEGYGSNDLDPFFLNPDLLQHWQGETALTDLYAKAIATGQSTGQFIEALSDLEPAYLEHTVKAADLLLAKSAELMATAGGTGHGLNRTNLNSGAKWGIRAAGLTVGGVLVGGVSHLIYKRFKKSDAVNPDSLAKDATQAGERSLENQAKDIFGGKDKMQDAQIVAKKDFEIQAKKYADVSNKIETKTREGLDDYERNHDVLIKYLDSFEKNSTDYKNAAKDALEKERDAQIAMLKDVKKNPGKYADKDLDRILDNSLKNLNSNKDIGSFVDKK